MDPDPHLLVYPYPPARRRQWPPPIKKTYFAAAASGPPYTEAGASAAAGHPTASPEPSREHTRRLPPAMDSGEDPLTPGPRRRKQRRTVNPRRLPTNERFLFTAGEATKPADSSSSSQQRSDHPAPERTGSGTTVQQSVIYSDRPRRSQRTRPPQHVEHPSEMSAPIFSASGAAGFHSDHPGAEGAVTGTRIRQSVLYSNRPRRPQPRRRQTPLPTEEHPREVTISELDGSITNEPTLGPLSLSDPSPLAPRINDDDESSHLYGPGDVGHSIGPIGPTEAMPTSLHDSPYKYITVAEYLMSMEEKRKRDSDNEDLEKVRREMKEYLDKQPCVSLEEAFDRILAVEYAELTAIAAEKGTKPPRNPFLVDQETPSLQAQREDSMAISHVASPRVINDGKQWMRDEVTLCLRKHIEKTPYLAGRVFEVDELCHQCFNVENYMKVFHHYNFKVRMKMPASVEWTEELYFGEVKEIFGTKVYFCCPLEPNESGHCYACSNQGVEDLKHPVTGGFEAGLPDTATSNFCYSYDE